MQESRQESEYCFDSQRFAQNAWCRDARRHAPLPSNYAIALSSGPRLGHKTRKRRSESGGVHQSLHPSLCHAVVFAGQVERFRFDRLPIRGLVAVGDLTEGLFAKVALVPTRFASALGGVFVAVLFDLLGVDRVFASSRSGRSEDRSFVVADQGN